MQFKDHDDLPQSDQRRIPRNGQRDIIAHQRRPLARLLRLKPSNHLGNFQPAQVGIIRPALTEQKMAEVLCVYREVAVLRESEGAPLNVAIISYDEKPGIQAIASTAPDLPPQPGSHTGWAREHEYKRHGTLSLLAGIDLLSGQVHAYVEDRHRSREFIGFLKKLDAAYPRHRDQADP
jgi:hypothetical protein